MGYAVCHRDATGTLQVDDAASLDAAVAAVERLRNDDGPTDVRVFREVPIEVRTYYKVVIADEDGVASSAGSPASASEGSAPLGELPGAFPLGSPTTSSPVTSPPASDDADQGSNGDHHRRSPLFGRGG
jgi:hypothetical protein